MNLVFENSICFYLLEMHIVQNGRHTGDTKKIQITQKEQKSIPIFVWSQGFKKCIVCLVSDLKCKQVA